MIILLSLKKNHPKHDSIIQAASQALGDPYLNARLIDINVLRWNLPDGDYKNEDTCQRALAIYIFNQDAITQLIFREGV